MVGSISSVINKGQQAPDVKKKIGFLQIVRTVRIYLYFPVPPVQLGLCGGTVDEPKYVKKRRLL